MNIRNWPSAASFGAACDLSNKARGRAAVVILAKSLRSLAAAESTPEVLRRALDIAHVKGVEESTSLESAGLLLDIDGTRFIFVREGMDPKTKNWTIAHELGHTVVHLLRDLSLEDYEEAERRCEIFAAELLLPKSTFPGRLKTYSVRSFHDGALSASDAVAVPLRSVVIRMRQLGVLSGTRAASALARVTPDGMYEVLTVASDASLKLVLEGRVRGGLFSFEATELHVLPEGETLSRRTSSVQIDPRDPASVRSGWFRATRVSPRLYLLSYDPGRAV